MKPMLKGVAASAIALAVAQANAGTDPYFQPLTQSSAVASPNHINELNSPWQVPGGVSQENLTSMQEIESSDGQSTQRTTDGNRASMWDMLAYDPTGRYVFIPHETFLGAGVTRYDTHTDHADLIFAGDKTATEGGFDANTDFGAFDPVRFTPNGTLWAAEEWSGRGRVVEIMDPWATPEDPTAGVGTIEGRDYRVLDGIPRVSHEGINFSKMHRNEVIYFIDEHRSGSIYKLVFTNEGDYSKGQSFVLVTKGFTGDPTLEWNEAGNGDPAVQASRFGKAKWVPITDEEGNPLAGIPSPYEGESSRPGRDSADAVNGTPFGRPEDMSIGVSKNGNEMLYVTTTSEHAVISIENRGGNYAIVRQFASEANTPKNVGFLPTTAVLNSPDNLAIDALGNVYIIEDSPNSSDVGGDIWFARDKDRDGVAESLDHFMSIQVDGSEATGMIFNPQKPYEFVVAVQHPDSVAVTDENTAGHFGDAIWQFNIADVVAPTCQKGQKYSYHKYGKHRVKTCVEKRGVNFNRYLRRAARGQDPLNP